MNATLASPELAPEDLDELQGQLSRLDEIGETIYDRGDQKIVRFRALGQDLIAKSYRITSLKQRMAALFRYSRGRRSFRAGLRLRIAGVITPHPLLLKESGGLTPERCTLVTEYCPHTSLIELLLNQKSVPKSLPQKIRTLLKQLRSARYSHGDFHARNILVAPDGTPHLIDLDGMQYIHRESEVKRHNLKDRDRLLKSISFHAQYHAVLVSALGGPGESFPRLD